ncbi:MAG TPA: hypothetical protein VKQ72_17690 [Aggregatilineales bacterium]|nr:hypothetical protein [Aggregatilineales bacterium]
MQLFTNPTDILIILIIMLIVAGPKRMVQWAYTLGRYTAQLRAMFQETMNAVQKEISEAGLDIQKDLPSLTSGRFDLMNEVNKVMNAPLKEDATPQSTPSVPQQPSSGPSQPSGAATPDEKTRYDAWLPK